MSNQAFYHYSVLEEHHFGMWRIVPVPQRQGFINGAARLMRAPEQFKAAMLRVVDEWPLSCEAALTTPSLNRRAWMGHAGCCLVAGSSEDLTRLAWHTLTEPQQDAANAVADDAIAEWERRQALNATPSLWGSV